MYSDEIIEHAKMPCRMLGIGHAFRAEGSSGSNNRGLFRVHQFSKVEMFSLTSEEESMDEFERFVNIQRNMYAELGLSFRFFLLLVLIPL